MTMRIGLMLPPEVDPADIPRVAVTAEEQGFDFLACGEHVFFHAAASNAFVSLAAAAAATNHIRLLSALTVVPLYPAGLLAKMVSTLDRVSHGRFDFGIGVGGEYPPEFEACGVPVGVRGAKTDESLEICTRLFGGERLTFSGRFATVERQRLAPLPWQPGGPPVWVGGRQSAALHRAARYGHYWIPYMVSPERLREGLDCVQHSASEMGRPDLSVSGAIFAWSATDARADFARDTALSTLATIYNQDFERLADRCIPTGTPDQVAERLSRYVDAGAEAVLISPACPVDQLPSMAELFAAEVLPALRQAAPYVNQ